MAISYILAGAFLSAILEETWNEVKEIVFDKPATKIFEDSAQKLEDKRILENINMRDLLTLCNPGKYPESRKIIEGAYQNLDITEKEKEQLFRDFKKVFQGSDKDLGIVFKEFLDIFLKEVVENCRDTEWKYWVWMQLKEKGKRNILLESFEEASNFDEKDAKWFRGSPFWIDFEENKIYRREEVDIIKEKLKKENIQIVYGDAASGKSVIVRYIGYEYCKKPQPVYLVNLKTEKLEDYKGDIVDLLDRNVLLIIEDAHIAFHDVDWVVKKASGRKLEVLVSTRPIEKMIMPREPTRFEVLMKREKNLTKVNASNGAEEIIRYYFSKKYRGDGINKSEEVINNLAQEYGKDLWFLSFALEAFQPEAGVDVNKVYKSIYERYLEKVVVGKDKIILDVYKYLHPLCIFYQYEIPVCKDFLLKKLCLNEMYLNQLIEAGEILQKGRMLFLHHSSRAKYFLKTMLCLKLCKEEELRFMRDYIQSFCEFACDVIAKISEFPYEKFDLVRSLVSDSGTSKEIASGMYKNDSPETIRKCFSGIAVADESAAKNLTEDFARRIDEFGLRDIGLCLSWIAKFNRNVAKYLVEEINKEKLVKEMNKTHNLDEITTCLSGIIEANEETARELIGSIDRKKLSKKINSSNLWRIADCISKFVEADPNVARNLTEEIDKKKLVKKINRANNLEKVGWCLLKIAEANGELADYLAEKMNIERIVEKIDRQAGLLEIGTFLSGVSEANKNVAEKLVRRMDIEKLKKKIEKADGSWEIRKCLSGISAADQNVAQELVRNIDTEKSILSTLDYECSHNCIQSSEIKNK